MDTRPNDTGRQITDSTRPDIPAWTETRNGPPRSGDWPTLRGATLLAHNYQLPAIQDVADHVGDSLALSRIAADAAEDTIVFCGVHFMAETAKILSPEKTVLIPDQRAGCSLADSITADELRPGRTNTPAPSSFPT